MAVGPEPPPASRRRSTPARGWDARLCADRTKRGAARHAGVDRQRGTDRTHDSDAVGATATRQRTRDRSRLHASRMPGCAGDGVGSSGPLQGTATLAWTRYGSARSKLPEIAARLQGPGELLLAGNRPAEARVAARLLGVLNRWSAAPVLPTPAPSDRPGPSTSGGYQLLVSVPSSAAGQLDLPLDIQPSLNIASRGSIDRCLSVDRIAPSSPSSTCRTTHRG